MRCSLEVLFCEVGAAVNILDDDETHEPLVSGLIFEGSRDKRAHHPLWSRDRALSARFTRVRVSPLRALHAVHGGESRHIYDASHGRRRCEDMGGFRRS